MNSVRTADAIAGEVLAALDDTPRTTKAIWRRLDCWAPSTIAVALNELVARRLAIKGTEPGRIGTRNTYRRAAASASGAA